MKFILLYGFALAITSCAEMAMTYHPGGEPKECYNAKTTLQMSRTE